MKSKGLTKQDQEREQLEQKEWDQADAIWRRTRNLEKKASSPSQDSSQEQSDTTPPKTME